jgi:hypothetical protein
VVGRLSVAESEDVVAVVLHGNSVAPPGGAVLGVSGLLAEEAGQVRRWVLCQADCRLVDLEAEGRVDLGRAQRQGAAGDEQLPVLVGQTEDQPLGSLRAAGNSADHGVHRDVGLQLQPCLHLSRRRHNVGCGEEPGAPRWWDITTRKE